MAGVFRDEDEDEDANDDLCAAPADDDELERAGVATTLVPPERAGVADDGREPSECDLLIA